MLLMLLDMFPKEYTSKKNSKKWSIFLRLHPLGTMKIYFLFMELEWHWLKGTHQEFRCLTCAPSLLYNLEHVTLPHFFAAIYL